MRVDYVAASEDGERRHARLKPDQLDPWVYGLDYGFNYAVIDRAPKVCDQTHEAGQGRSPEKGPLEEDKGLASGLTS